MTDKIKNSFLQYLINLELSKASLKFYKSDIKHFASWLIFKCKALGASPENLTDVIPFISKNTAEEYKNYLTHNKIPVKTINRRFSVLRHFGRFLKSTNILDYNFTKDLKNIQTSKPISPFEGYSNQFASSLKSDKASPLTIKNYLSDVNQFLYWTGKIEQRQLSHITSKDIKRYIV